MTKTADKKLAILNSAGPVFMKYGYNRTTMGLIAEAAGMSRPALYLIYPGKEEVFSAAVLWMTENLLREISQKTNKTSGLEKKLLVACEAWSLSIYEVHAASLPAKDMDDLEFPAVRSLYARFEEFITDLMIEGESRRTFSESKCRHCAHMLVYALRGCRLGARDRQDMLDMTRLLVASASQALAADVTGSGRRKA